MASFYQRLLNFFFPFSCAACGQPLEAAPEPASARIAGKKSNSSNRLSVKNAANSCPTAAACVFYAAKTIIILNRSARSASITKWWRRPSISSNTGNKLPLQFLGNLLIDYLNRDEKLRESFDLIIPVPLHWLRYHKRGFNQAGLLAKTLAAGFGKPLIIPELTPGSPHQTSIRFTFKTPPAKHRRNFAVKTRN